MASPVIALAVARAIAAFEAAPITPEPPASK